MSFHLAGFVGVAPTPRPDFLTEPLSDPFLTISDCLNEDLLWDEWEGWYADADEVPVEQVPGSEVLAIALAPNDATALTAEFHDRPEFVGLLQERRGLPDAASRIGFEIVGIESPTYVHSWHCHEYADIVDALGFALNEHGLLASFYAADAVLHTMLNLPPEQAPNSEAHWTIVALARVPNGPGRR